MDIKTAAPLDELKRQLVQLEEIILQNTKHIEKQQEMLDLYKESLQLFCEEDAGRIYVLNNFVYPIETQLQDLHSRQENLLDELKFKQGVRLILKEELAIRA
ncbi:hypothetical protein [Paenibacillus gallinarum]|uniref:Cingulin n=1 Tax=Paenibacillus gallinarum TaxID=2762232 RepID=A0ABR8T477_9BACL|nr:hypothetical protein [Paenibacillus gallinarum]MBD7970582.1 hypothetical protein [Paenibacillus gallinarum]